MLLFLLLLSLQLLLPFRHHNSSRFFLVWHWPYGDSSPSPKTMASKTPTYLFINRFPVAPPSAAFKKLIPIFFAFPTTTAQVESDSLVNK